MQIKAVLWLFQEHQKRRVALSHSPFLLPCEFVVHLFSACNGSLQCAPASHVDAHMASHSRKPLRKPSQLSNLSSSVVATESKGKVVSANGTTTLRRLVANCTRTDARIFVYENIQFNLHSVFTVCIQEYSIQFALSVYYLCSMRSPEFDICTSLAKKLVPTS